MACKGVPCYLGYKALPFLRSHKGTMSEVPHDRKMCLKTTFSSIFSPYQTNQHILCSYSERFFRWVTSTCSLVWGKSPCEQFIMFTCNIHTHDSSISRYIDSHYKVFYSPLKTYGLRTWVLVYVKSRVQQC
jgi:hypothetical protein